MMATSSSWLVQLAGGEEAMQRQAVSVGVSLPVTLTPGCCLLWCLRGNLAPADELSGVADELLSLQVSQRQSASVDELSGVVDELLSLQVSQRQSGSC